MRAFILAATTVLLAGNAAAQSSPQDLDRLKQLLDDKLGSSQTRTRSLPKPQKPLKTDDFYVVRPDGSIDKPPAQDKRSSADGQPYNVAAAAAHWFSASAASLAASLSTPAEAGASKAAAPDADQPVAVAQLDNRTRSAPQVQRDSYVVQLRTDLTSEQLDEAISTLRNKYNLEITRSNNSLGILHVSPAPSNKRSIGPAQREPSTLGAALEPQIIKDLRQEPFVDAAYVNFSLGPKTVPRRSDLKVKSNTGTYTWHWRSGETDDGNWGLKSIRMPPVWTILDHSRKANPDRPRTRLVFLDTGFGVHSQLTYNEVLGGMPVRPPFTTCEQSHGTHVAGIAGAMYGKGRGTDGMVPDSKIDAIPVGSDLFAVGTAAGVLTPTNLRAVLFANVIDSLSEYMDAYPLEPGEKQVINVSLAYNWSTVGFEFGKDEQQDENVKTHVINTARTVQRLAARLKDSSLIVAAAGNDSDGHIPPQSAEWSTPFAFAGVHQAANYQTSKNILIVEAYDRDRKRAAFSNGGGHVSAPGVDVMSTLAGVNDAYGLCTGTSQASPHVAALAAILLELAPGKTPAEIAEIIKGSAVQKDADAAPRIDALAATLKLSPDNLRYLVDLNGDGKVDEDDLEIYKTQLAALAEAEITDAPITMDLNGDGNIDDDERCWPLIDFNGSGKAAIGDSDAQDIAGSPKTDMQVIESAWTDTAKPFKTAVSEIGLDQLITQWKAADAASTFVASVKKKPPCN